MRLLFLCSALALAQPYDLLIRNGTVVDGTGKKAFRADVGIRDGKIELVGAAKKASAKKTLDARGLIVAAGFVDVHNHTERAIATPERRFNEGFLRQGVTTIVGGPDGSASPKDMRQLLAAYQKNGVATNVAFYVGHNAIRREVVGMDHRLATPDELAKMRALVREGMELGAVGLSTGLMYEPGMWADTAEVVALASEVRPFGGTYDSHVRDPVKRFLESDEECIEIGRRAGIPAKIAHEKAVALENAGKIRDVIAMVERARQSGHEVVTDQYPYDGAATGTLQGIIVVPPDLRAQPDFDLKKALRDPALRARIRDASENGVNGGFAWLKATGYTAMRITSSKDYPSQIGKYLSQISEERKLARFDALAELYLASEHPVGITLGAIKEEDVRLLMKQPWNMIASDGAYVDAKSKPNGEHPRATGTFPRVLGHYVRDTKVLTLEDAVYKMTWLPASHLRLTDRGKLAPGLAADVTVFNPKTIRDLSTWDEPNRYSEGVVHVIVNGVPVVESGGLTGAAPGVFVKRR